MKKHISLIVVIIFSLIIQSSNVSANTAGNIPIISFDNEQGMTIVSTTSISGYIEDGEEPTSIWWTLLSDSSIINSDIITDKVSIVNSTENRTKWTFNINIDYEINSCTCYLEIYVQTESGQIFIEVLSFYILEETESADTKLLAPALVIDKDQENSWFSDDFHFTGFTNKIDNSNPYMTYSIQLQSQNLDCRDTSNEQYLDMEYSDIIFDDSIYRLENSGNFHARVNLNNFSDGNYVMYVGSHSDKSPIEGTMSMDCIKFRIDKTSPTVSIYGLTKIVEGSENIQFDASDSLDPQWGRSELYYIWTFSKNTSFDNTPVFIKSGREMMSINIPTNDSGHFQLKLQIIDKAGNIGTNKLDIIIENIPPFVRLNVNDQSQFDGDTIDIKEGESIYLDASKSSDTVNDANSLRYIWKINNIPTYEGSTREIEWPENIRDGYILTLEVIDNDNQASTISLIIGKSQADSPFNIYILFLLGSFGFLIYSISSYRRKRQKQGNIPKWV